MSDATARQQTDPLDADSPLNHQAVRKALMAILSGLRQGDTVMDVASRILRVAERIDKGELDAPAKRLTPDPLVRAYAEQIDAAEYAHESSEREVAELEQRLQAAEGRLAQISDLCDSAAAGRFEWDGEKVVFLSDLRAALDASLNDPEAQH